MAARISTASRPSRKTMIAELVTTVVRLALSPSVPRASSSSSSRARRVARTSRRAAPLEISSARPGWPLAPNQISPSMSVARPGVDRLQPPLGAELEERVGLEPGLLGLAALAGADRGLHAVERQRDQVVVGVVGRLLPGRGHDRLELLLDRGALLLDRVVARDAGLALPGLGDVGAELVDLDRDRAGAGAVALGELVAQVVEGGVGGGLERDRLLDLEVERHAPVLDPAAVLDRHERDEAQQLLGAAGRLGGGEGRGGEAVERGVDLRARDGDAAAVALRGARPQVGELARGGAGRRPRRGPGGSAARGSASSRPPAPRSPPRACRSPSRPSCRRP